MVVPVEVTVFDDRSFTFVTKTPPTPNLLRAAAGVPKGAKNTGVEKVGSVSKAQLEEIARTKMPDLNTKDLDAAMLQVAGTARSMGITIDD
jgi:large subunit ribosomal protein L11